MTYNNKEGLPPQSLQGEFRLNIDRQETSEELAQKELIGKAYKVLLSYAEGAIYPLYDKVRRGEGKQVLSITEEGRPGEELLDIDQTGENVLKAAIREAKMPAVLISENSPEPHIFGNGGPEKLYVFADPFDNTSQYKRGLDTPPYTVVSIFDGQGNSIGAVVGDIKDRKAYMNLGKENFIIDIKDRISEKEKYTEKKVTLLENQKKLLQETVLLQTNTSNGASNINLDQLAKTNLGYLNSEKQLVQLEKDFREALNKEHKRVIISPSERTTLKERNSTLATFVGEKEYSSKFFKYFGGLVNDMHPKGLLYTGGGAYIYGLLASGAVDAYVMFDEPLSEIIPGLPLARAAGCTVASVSENGSYTEFNFDPKMLQENHKLYSEGSIPLFIAAATPEIKDEIIRYYLKAKRKIEETERTNMEGNNFFKDPDTIS